MRTLTVDQENKILKELKEIMHKFTMEHYGVPLNVPVYLSGRLTVRYGYFKIQQAKIGHSRNGRYYKAGDYILEDMKIVLSKALLRTRNKDFIISVAKHEALHYALFITGKPFFDGDKLFEKELKRHKIVSTSHSATTKGITSRYWVWVCGGCKTIVKIGGKTRKDYSKGYHSNCCFKPLIEKGWQDIKPGQTKVQ